MLGQSMGEEASMPALRVWIRAPEERALIPGDQRAPCLGFSRSRLVASAKAGLAAAEGVPVAGFGIVRR